MELKKYWRIFFFYLLVQIVIWIKAALFFQWFGAGQVSLSNQHLFPSQALLPDWVFHEAMHVLIAVAAFSFGRKLDKINYMKLFLIVLIAVVLHNIGYWLTNVFNTFYGLILDFAMDTIVLFAFIIASNYLAKKYSFFRNLRIPLLH